jgi:SAM-dependent methyltransferase
MLPPLIDRVFKLLSSSSPLTITELGAGTGRNTIKLLSPSTALPISRINALDLSPGMLAVAKSRCAGALGSDGQAPQVAFYEFDALRPANYPLVSSLSLTADLVVSTLVLEHLPLSDFFRTVKWLLKPEGGYLVLTNMHADMGRKSQAGFVDEETGEKVRGDSFVYEVSEVLEEGKKWGFVLEEEVGERGVRKEDIGEGELLGERGKKWIGCLCWFGCVMRLQV